MCKRGRSPVGKDVVLTASVEFDVMRCTDIVHIHIGDSVVTSTDIDQHSVPSCDGITELKASQGVVVRGDGDVQTVFCLRHPNHPARGLRFDGHIRRIIDAPSSSIPSLRCSSTSRTSTTVVRR